MDGANFNQDQRAHSSRNLRFRPRKESPTAQHPDFGFPEWFFCLILAWDWSLCELQEKPTSS